MKSKFFPVRYALRAEAADVAARPGLTPGAVDHIPLSRCHVHLDRSYRHRDSVLPDELRHSRLAVARANPGDTPLVCGKRSAGRHGRSSPFTKIVYRRRKRERIAGYSFAPRPSGLQAILSSAAIGYPGILRARCNPGWTRLLDLRIARR